MLEKINEFAERAATNVSRRQFLGRVGRGALAASAAVGGLLAHTANAQSGGNSWCGPASYSVCLNKKPGWACIRSDGLVGKCKVEYREIRGCICQ